MLNKDVYGELFGQQKPKEGWDLELSTVIALIEIREAIENLLAPETNGMNKALLDIAGAIRENTAVQRDMLKETLAARNEIAELLEKIRPLIETVDGHSLVVQSLGELLDETLESQTKQAQLLAKLAEEKQDKPGSPG